VGDLPKSTDRRDLIKRFKALGWTGPHKGTGRHPEYMAKGAQVVKIPNPHSRRSDVGEPLLKRILQHAGISIGEWLGITEVDGGKEEKEEASGGTDNLHSNEPTPADRKQHGRHSKRR